MPEVREYLIEKILDCGCDNKITAGSVELWQR